MLPEHKVEVEALENGRWAQEPWKPQLEITKGEKYTVSVSLAIRLEGAGLCKIIDKNPQNPPKQVKSKAEKSPAKKDKKAAQG